MLEGEATQESPALEGAQAPAPTDAEQEPSEASASPAEGDSSEPAATEAAEAEAEAEAATEVAEAEAAAPEAEVQPATALDWSHLRGFQSVEPPAAELASREDYAQEHLKELAARAARFARSVDDSIVLSSDGLLRWLGDPVARIVSSDDLLRPRAILLADEALVDGDRASVDSRVSLWLAAHMRKVLGPLISLAEGADLPDAARTVAAKIADALGVLERERVRNDVRSLDQNARGALRKLGVRFGSLYIYVPLLLKPAARGLCTLLWTLRRGVEPGADRLLAFAAAGRTSFANEGLLSPDAYRVAGFRLCGERVVRVDIIERLSDLIRAAIPDHMRSGSRPTTEAYGFVVTPQMTSLTGCSGEPFSSILRSLGFEPAKVSKAAYEAANRKAPTEPIKPAGGEAEAAPAEEPSAVAEPYEVAQAAGGDELAAAEAPATIETAEASEAVPESAESEGELAAAEAPGPVETAEAEAAESVSQDEPPEVVEAVAEPETAPQDETAEVAQEAEIVLEGAAADEEIEIWRPAPRRPRAPHHRPHGAEPQREGNQEGRQPHSKPHRRHGRPAEAVKPAETAAEAPAPAAEEARPHGPRPPRPERHNEGQGQQRRSEGRPQQERTREERRPQKDFAPRRESRPVQVDPDSPFAKLAALKPLLERRDKRP